MTNVTKQQQHTIQKVYEQNIHQLYTSYEQVPSDGEWTTVKWIELHLTCAEHKFCMSPSQFITSRENYFNHK